VIAVSLLGRIGFGLQPLPWLLLMGAGACAVLVGLASAIGGGDDARPDVDVELSFSSVTVSAGFVLALVGVAAGGEAFFWPGVGLVFLGGGGLVRETFGARSARRQGGLR
jgi:hypothetical protein